MCEMTRRTCGAEIIGVLAAKWEACDGITVVRDVPRLPNAVARALRQLGFNDTIDKLVLRLSTSTRNRIAVSDDGDFWDPRDAAERGKKSACVARLCREQLDVTVMLLGTVLGKSA